jgi:hypothetical protein
LTIRLVLFFFSPFSEYAKLGGKTAWSLVREGGTKGPIDGKQLPHFSMTREQQDRPSRCWRSNHLVFKLEQ